MRSLKELKIGKWIPDYCMVRTEFGWSLPSELTKKEQLLIFEDNTVKGVRPKSYYKVPYKGKLIGFEKILFKPSDVNKSDEWFGVNSLTETRAFGFKEYDFDGYLYSFDVDPIIAYEYRVSKVNNNNLLKLEYVL